MATPGSGERQLGVAPSRERELKLSPYEKVQREREVAPSRERELKHQKRFYRIRRNCVAPSRERELKPEELLPRCNVRQSLPHGSVN